MHDAAGASLWLSLALSSIPAAIRAVAALAAERRANLLALLMLAVNLALTGIFQRRGPGSRVPGSRRVAISICLVRCDASSPPGSADLARGPEWTAAWDRLRRLRPPRLQLMFSMIWGLALLAECAARLVGAYTIPVTTMVWLGTVFTLSSIGLAIVIGGAAAAPIQKLIDAETGASGR